MALGGSTNNPEPSLSIEAGHLGHIARTKSSLSAIIQKRMFFERPPDTATSSAPKAQSSVRLSVRVATAHNPHFNPCRAGLKLPPTPGVARLPD